MSKTVSTCICDTNLVPNQPQENVFFHSLYRTKEDFNSEFLRSATSTSPIQIMALFSTQGPDNLGAYLNIELTRELQAIANEVYKNSVLDFDSFANKVINTLNVKVCNFVVKNGGTPLKTSMSLAVIEGDILRIISVGNTRAVLIRDGRIFSLSEEQTVAHRYAQMGVISAEQEATHPENMTLTQYLGKMPQDGQVMADTKVHLKLKDNDEICLMGIGISKKVPASLRNRVLVAASQPEIKCKELISAAFNREVKAGMTVMVMKIESVFLLPGDAVFGADPSHEVANKKQESSYEGESSYTDFTKENQKNSNNNINNPSSQKRNYSGDSEEGKTTMFNSGKINADPVTKGKKNKNEGKKENKVKNILIPIIILLVFTGLGYLIMFVAFNAVHLLDFFDKKDTDIADTEAIVMYSIQDNVPVYESDSLDSAIIGTLNRGDVVSAKSVGESFTKVSTTAGVEGYVLNAQLSEEDPTITDELPEIETEVTPIPTEDTTEETTEATETEATTQATEATTAATEATTTAATTEATTTAATTEATTTTAATESTTTEATSAATSETSQTSSTETAAPSETPAESNVTPDQGEVTEN